MSKQGRVSRMQQVRNNPPKTKKGDNGERTPATEADYIAVQLHAEREMKNHLRLRLSAKEKEIVDLQREYAEKLSDLQVKLGIANQTILQLEIDADKAANERLRQERAFKLGRTVVKDDDGSIFWETPQDEPAVEQDEPEPEDDQG